MKEANETPAAAGEDERDRAAEGDQLVPASAPVDKSLSPRRKKMLALSIAIVALGVLTAVLSTIFVPDLSETRIENIENLRGAVAIVRFLSIFFAIIGLFGIRGARNPRKLVAFMVMSAIGVTLGSLTILGLVADQVFLFSVTPVAAVMVVASAMCLRLAFEVRKTGDGIDRSQLGPDGIEFPNGFNPNKLGFMRVMQIVFAFNVLMSVVALTTYVKGSYEITFSFLLDLVNLMFDGVLFWMLFRRYNVTRKFAVFVALFNILVGTGYNVFTGEFAITSQLWLCLGDIVMLLYFLTSQRAKAVLTRPFSSPKVADMLGEGDNSFYDWRKWSFWRSVVIYFCIFCVVGHWAEAGYCLFIKYGILPGVYDPTSQIWSDWLYPFPVYGCGMVACIILLFPIKNVLQRKVKNTVVAVVLSFVINAAVCTSIELVMGLIQNQPVNGVYPLWDYSNMFCNFMGQICLQNALAFGAISTFMVWAVYPLLEKFMVKLPNNVANTLFIMVVIFYAILTSLYLVNVAM